MPSLLLNAEPSAPSKHPSGVRISYLLLGLGCFLFTVSKYITSGGRITLSQPEYWLLGSIPVLALLLVSGWFRKPTARSTVFEQTFLVWCWLFSLAAFISLRSSLLSETFEFPLYEALNYNPLLCYVPLAVIYSAFGFVAALGVRALLQGPAPTVRTGAGFVTIALLGNFLMFLGLVFLLPAKFL